MEINEIKLIMITEYKRQFNKIFDKFKRGNLDLKGLIFNINRLNYRYNFLRVDIKNYGNLSNNIEFFEYGHHVRRYDPDWFKNDVGVGYQLEGYKDDFGVIFKCINPGNLKIFVRGVDFKDIDNIRVPIYINFTNLMINNEVILDQNYLIWHNEPYIFEKSCENQQYLGFELKFKTLFDYFPSLYFQISDDISEDELIIRYSNVNKYIDTIIDLLNKKII